MLKIKNNILIIILLLVIGFASVTTSLILTGTLNIGFNEDDYDVIFIEAKMNGENATISADKHTVEFTTNKLSLIGEQAILFYKIKNNSTQYNADITLSCNMTSDDYKDYISISGTLEGEDLPLTTTLDAQEIKNGEVIAELIKEYLLDNEETSIVCTITSKPSGRSSNAYTVNFNSNGGSEINNIRIAVGEAYGDLPTPTRENYAFLGWYTETTDVKVTSEDIATEENLIAKWEYQEDILNGTYPVLKNSLIPVTIENDGTVKKADLSSEWYNYDEKIWANAVILVNEETEYNEGDPIPEDNIESYFVWIPRYKYQLWNTSNVSVTDLTSYAYNSETVLNAISANKREIQIEFESKDTTPSTGSTNNTWLTHPAFTTFDVNGIWVGKFETGYSGAASTAAAQVTNATETNKIIVKPNVYSWRNNKVGNFFKLGYNYKRELDSHMMKNTEWGAVAYLSHSKYGINTEVNINNNSNYITGYSAVEGTDQSSYTGTSGTDESVTKAYNTTTGYKASTTGNISGVYDISGGAWEYVAGYMDGYGVTSSGSVSSGLTASDLTRYAKYLDKYSSSSTITSYQYRILGDATGEMGNFVRYKDKDSTLRYHNSWYGDYSIFVDSTYPWFVRGGRYYNGVLAGQFSFDRDTGGVLTDAGFRLVLV